MSTRLNFQNEIEGFRTGLVEMASLALSQVERGVQAWEEVDAAAAREVVAGDDQVDIRCAELDQKIYSLQLLEAPVAGDQRLLHVGLIAVIALERVGDLAVNVAEAGKRYLQHAPVKPLIDIPRMGDIAQLMLRDALDAFVRGDVALAEAVLIKDDTLDGLKTQIFRELLTYMLQDPLTIEPALDLILISRHLERIGDHATNIAEDVIFMVSARDVRHQPVEPSADRPA